MHDLVTSEVVAIESLQGGLYKLDELPTCHASPKNSKVLPQRNKACLAAESTSAHLWHSKLRHLSPKSLSHISNINVNSQQYFCEVCPLAHQQRLVFFKNKINTNESFQLVHIDLQALILAQVFLE